MTISIEIFISYYIYNVLCIILEVICKLYYSFMLQMYILYFKTIYKRAKKYIKFSFVCVSGWF